MAGTRRWSCRPVMLCWLWMVAAVHLISAMEQLNAGMCICVQPSFNSSRVCVCGSELRAFYLPIFCPCFIVSTTTARCQMCSIGFQVKCVCVKRMRGDRKRKRRHYLYIYFIFFFLTWKMKKEKSMGFVEESAALEAIHIRFFSLWTVQRAKKELRCRRWGLSKRRCQFSKALRGGVGRTMNSLPVAVKENAGP